MCKLYTFEINLDTLETEANEFEKEDYPEESTGYATYEEFDEGWRVYAESLISLEHAKQLVEEFCLKFGCAAYKIQQENFYD